MSFYSDSFDAMGVVNQVTVTGRGALEQAGRIAREHVAELDRACSRFRADGEILALNRSGTGGLQVSPLLFAATEAALGGARDSDGLVDPTVGAALRGLGYDRDFELVAQRSPDGGFELVPATGWRSVRLDPQRRRITLAAGTELDLGATAKALAADWIARAIGEATRSEVLVSLGGDIAVVGSPERGWPIHVGEDHKRFDGGQVVAIHQGGLATSSTTVRRWRAGATDLHHIVDPATGGSAREYWRTVSVTAGSCFDANVASTAAIVLGAGAPEWIARRGFAARLVRSDGHIETVGGWPLAAATESPSPRANQREEMSHA